MVIETLSEMGWRPVLIGGVVFVIAAVAGWGMAADRSFGPVRAVAYWLERVVLPGVRRASWLGRTVFIFLNNASTCALITAAGRVGGGSWCAIVIVGLAVGMAVRLVDRLVGEGPVGPDAAGEMPGEPGADVLLLLGVALNLLEVPALAVVLGLSMGRLWVGGAWLPVDVWQVYAVVVAPLLLVAAGGEALWLGRHRLI